MSDCPRYEDVPVPRLMREARDVYRDAVGRALADAGCDYVPRNAVFVPAAWVTARRSRRSAPGRCRRLAGTEQASGQPTVPDCHRHELRGCGELPAIPGAPVRGAVISGLDSVASQVIP